MKNLPANLSKALGAMQEVSKAIDTQSGNFNYLKMDKTGVWVHGANEEELHDDSLFAVDAETFIMGFQAWEDNELEGEEIRLITEPPVLKADLEQGLDWKNLLGFQLIGVHGGDNGLPLLYKTTSVGGIKAVNGLMKEIVARTQVDHKGEVVPVVKLSNDSYKHKKYGKIFTPVLEIVEWVDELPSIEDGEPVEQDEPVEQEQEVEQEQPVRRRKRRA